MKPAAQFTLATLAVLSLVATAAHAGPPVLDEAPNKTAESAALVKALQGSWVVGSTAQLDEMFVATFDGQTAHFTDGLFEAIAYDWHLVSPCHLHARMKGSTDRGMRFGFAFHDATLYLLADGEDIGFETRANVYICSDREMYVYDKKKKTCQGWKLKQNKPPTAGQAYWESQKVQCAPKGDTVEYAYAKGKAFSKPKALTVRRGPVYFKKAPVGVAKRAASAAEAFKSYKDAVDIEELGTTMLDEELGRPLTRLGAKPGPDRAFKLGSKVWLAGHGTRGFRFGLGRYAGTGMPAGYHWANVFQVLRKGPGAFFHPAATETEIAALKPQAPVLVTLQYGAVPGRYLGPAGKGLHRVAASKFATTNHYEVPAHWILPIRDDVAFGRRVMRTTAEGASFGTQLAVQGDTTFVAIDHDVVAWPTGECAAFSVAPLAAGTKVLVPESIYTKPHKMVPGTIVGPVDDGVAYDVKRDDRKHVMDYSSFDMVAAP